MHTLPITNLSPSRSSLPGDVTIAGNLTVSGTTTAVVNQTTTGTVAITVTNAAALTVENATGTDVFVVNTTTPGVTVTGALTVTTDLAVNGGDITSTATTFNLLNTTVTTLNIGGAATQVTITTTGVGIGTTAPSSLLNVYGNSIDVNVGINISGFRMYNTDATPVFKFNITEKGTPNRIRLSSGLGEALHFTTNNNETGGMLIDTADNVGIGTTSPDRLLHAEAVTALTATVQPVFRISHITSGTPANSIGVGMEFEQETSASNNEVIATIEAIVTDVTATSEDADIVFKVMAAGAAAAEQFRIASDGGLFAQTLLQQSAAGLVVEWDSTGKEIYAETSALRFKDNVVSYQPPIGLFDLTPKQWTDKATGRSEFGLIAEEVAEVFPDLAVYDSEGRPIGVKYHKLAVALLGEVKRLRTLMN